jgi:hypothetical protein
MELFSKSFPREEGGNLFNSGFSKIRNIYQKKLAENMEMATSSSDKFKLSFFSTNAMCVV